MARAPRDSRIESRTARLKLPNQPEPYWRRIGEGLFIGYRRTAGTTAWICRRRQAKRYIEKRLGTPDDFLDADGVVVFTYPQACELARGIAAETMSPAPKYHGDGLSVNDCWQLYRDEHLSDKASLSNSEGFWKLHVQESLGGKMVASITTENYQTWLKELALKAPTRRGKQLPFDLNNPNALAARASSANRVWTVVKASLTYAKKHRKIICDHASWMQVEKIKVKSAIKLPPRMLSHDEVTRLLNACTPDFRELMTGALTTGARYGELCSMCVNYYNPETQLVKIVQMKTQKILYQPLSPEGVQFFERHTAGRSPDEMMFKHEDGSSWSKSQQQRPIKAAAAAANVPDISFKVTRATYGKMLLLATNDIELVAKALGHSSTKITREHYAQYLPSELKAAVRKMQPLGLEVGAMSHSPIVH